MKFDSTAKLVSLSPLKVGIYVPLIMLVFSAGVAWALTSRKIDDKAEKSAVKIVDDSLGRAVVYQAGRLDRIEAAVQTIVVESAEARADQKASLSLLCENFPAAQTRLVQIRCAAK